MKKWLPIVIILILVYIGYSRVVGFQNEAVETQENAKTKWSNVESAYQRRNDLIGNLVSTVKAAADFEKSTLTQVIEARAKATSTNIDANNLTPEMMAQFQQAQTGLSGALSKLMVVVEKYPELKANENFKQLQNQIEGTENRIKMERDRFNAEVNIYNKLIKKFPGSLLAGMMSFDEMSLYKSNPGSENAIDVGEKFKE